MELLQAIPGFALATFLLAIIPGQGMAMVLRQTLVGGTRTGVLSVLGNSTGLVIWGVLAAVGLAAVFSTSPGMYNTLKTVGVLYLFFVAGQTFWSLRTGKNELLNSEPALVQSPARAYRTGLITNLTNAKAAVFAVAFIPRFVPEGTSVAIGAVVLGCVWAVVSGGTYAMIIMLINQTSHLLNSPIARRRLTVASGVGIMVLATTLLLS